MYYPLSVSIHEILTKISEVERRSNPIVLKKASRLKLLLKSLQNQASFQKKAKKYA